MQTIHYVIAVAVGGLGLLVYVFNAGRWAARMDRIEEKHEDLAKWVGRLQEKDNDHEGRLTRVENDRRIVVFPKRRRRDEDDDDHGGH